MKSNELMKRGLYIIYLAILFMGSDFLIGKFFIDDDNCFKGWPLPPYGPVMTTDQHQLFERLTDSTKTDYIVYDQYLGWTIGPNRVSDDGMYISNSCGMRSIEEYANATPKGMTRIAAFGDSFTECAEVRNDEAWPYLLEQSDARLEVLNFGVRGYGTDQAWLRYRRDGKPFHPDVVLIGFMLENIRRNVNRYRPVYEHISGGLGVKPRFIAGQDGLVLLPNPIPTPQALQKLIAGGEFFASLGPHDYWLDRYAPAFDQKNIWFRSNIMKLSWLLYEKHERNLKRLYQDREGEPFTITTQILKTFYEEALRDGAHYAWIIIFPARSDLQDYLDNDSKFWQPLLDFLDQNGIPYLDPTAKLAQTHRQQSIIDAHYNLRGNEIIKGVLLRALQQKM